MGARSCVKRTWRGAILGFGHVALHGHLPAWQRQADFRIVAVCDPNTARRRLAEELLPGTRTYAEFEQVLFEERLDFVDIATPPGLHAAQVEAAARAGVHVLCEKPLTNSRAEFEHIDRCVRAAGVVLHTVHNWRFSEAYRTLRAEMHLEELGNVQRVTLETVRRGCAPGAYGLWRLDPARGLAAGVLRRMRELCWAGVGIALWWRQSWTTRSVVATPLP